MARFCYKSNASATAVKTPDKEKAAEMLFGGYERLSDCSPYALLPGGVASPAWRVAIASIAIVMVLEALFGHKSLFLYQ